MFITDVWSSVTTLRRWMLEEEEGPCSFLNRLSVPQKVLPLPFPANNHIKNILTALWGQRLPEDPGNCCSSVGVWWSGPWLETICLIICNGSEL